MSEHRRKPPSRGHRAAGSSGGRRAAPPRSTTASGSYQEPPERPYGSRAEARRAAQRGGRRRATASASEGMPAGGEGYGPGGPPGGRGQRRPEPPRKRLIDYPRAGKDGPWRWMPSWKQIFGTTLLFAAILIGLVGLAFAMVDVPSQNKAAAAQKNVYYWADGSRMVVHGESSENRQNIPLSRMPHHLQDSVTSAENHTFWDDSGVNPIGIGRAIVNMARGGDTQSGSTITQQFVKNNYLTQEQTLERKAKELLISVKVGATVKKEEILEGYLNTAYFGRGAHGIQAAAQAYYAKDAADLDPSEAAFLTTLLKGPDLFDPHGGTQGEAMAERNTNNATKRWSWVLDRRVEVGTLNANEREEYKEFPMPIKPTPATDLKGQIGYMVNMANRYLLRNDILSEQDLALGGFQIHTTFDKEKVDQMVAAVDAVKDKLDPETRKEDTIVRFSAAAVVPGDGALVAIYGGPSATEHFVNNATRNDVPVGSTFKPYVLAAALRDGVRDPDGPAEQGATERTALSPESIYTSEDGLLIHRYNGEVWLGEDENGEETDLRQKNYEGMTQGDITLREAMEVSANSPFVQLAMDVGIRTVAQAAIDAGIRPDELEVGPEDARILPNDSMPSFALGVSEVSAVSMANSYATFAASGEQSEVYTVTKLEGAKGLVYQHERSVKRTFDSAVADTVTDILAGVVKQGSGTSAQQIGKPAAAKTGTTDNNKSAWFAGYTPHLSTAVGMFRFDQQNPNGFQEMYGTGGLPKVTGGSFPADVWVAFMKEATQDDPKDEFPEPDEIGEVVYGGGAESPEPTPTYTPEPTEEPTEEPDPSDDPEPSQDPRPTREPEPTVEPDPDPTDDCNPWEWPCGDTAGPGDPGGPGGGDPGGSDSGGDSGGDDSNNSGGGLIRGGRPGGGD